MRSYINKIKAPKYYNLRTTCHIHGWKNLAPFSWDESNHYLHFALLAEDEPVEVSAQQHNDDIVIETVSRSVLNADKKARVSNAVIRALDLAADTTELYRLSKSINSEYGALVRNGAGRMLRAPTLWEDAAKTLFTTNCSWGLTKIMCQSACSANFSVATARGAYPFPAIEKICRAPVPRLKDKMRVGYRAAYLKNLAARLKQDRSSVDIEKLTENELRHYFGSIQGFGPYATNHILVLCGVYNQIPVDTVVKSYLQQHHQTEDYLDYIDSSFGKWGEYKWWGLKLEMMINGANWLGD